MARQHHAHTRTHAGLMMTSTRTVHEELPAPTAREETRATEISDLGGNPRSYIASSQPKVMSMSCSVAPVISIVWRATVSAGEAPSHIDRSRAASRKSGRLSAPSFRHYPARVWGVGPHAPGVGHSRRPAPARGRASLRGPRSALTLVGVKSVKRLRVFKKIFRQPLGQNNF